MTAAPAFQRRSADASSAALTKRTPPPPVKRVAQVSGLPFASGSSRSCTDGLALTPATAAGPLSGLSYPVMSDRPLQRISYVEDDEDIQRIVRMSLERVGKMTVDVVSDSTTAMVRIASFKPDLVMLDWMMPGLDGPSLFRLMKQDPEAAKLPVVFITAKATQRDTDELIALGAAGMISKPFSPKDLPDQLRAIWAKLP